MSIGRQLSVAGLILALAAIDFVGALVAQDYADRRRMSALLLGSVLSVALFVVYAVALRMADLSIVTMGWIVMLQVALIGFDVVRNGLHLGAAQWTAVALVLVAQVFLTVTTEGRSPAAHGSGWVAPAQTSIELTAPGRSPVTRKTTLRATDTAWSANRS